MLLKRGFTLSELVAVMSIMAVLSLIGNATYSNYIGNVRVKKLQTDLSLIHDSLQVASVIRGVQGNYCNDGASSPKYYDLFELDLAAVLADGRFKNFSEYYDEEGQEGRDNIDAVDEDELEENAIHTPFAIGTLPHSDCFQSEPPNTLESVMKHYTLASNFDRAREDYLVGCELNEKTYTLGGVGYFKSQKWVGMSLNDRGFFKREDYSMPPSDSPCN